MITRNLVFVQLSYFGLASTAFPHLLVQFIFLSPSRHSGLPPPLIRKKTIAPKPPVQPPPNSLSIPAPNASRLLSTNQTVPCDTRSASPVVLDTKSLDVNSVNDASPSITDADHRSVSQPKDDRPKRPLPPSFA
ncbi:unnamed protein product [Dicrocoelium dendriticum]|nr:unnamed protein product [Dicrocoelium dendriticum]